jgi:hypothetical protein
MSIHFVLDAFESSSTMNVSATLDSGAAPGDISDISATAVYYIPLDTMKSVFRFSSNSWDIDDVSATDVHYFTFMENWPDSLQINPAHAMLDKAPDSSNAVRTGLEPAKMLVKHDFVRHLALELFKTTAGVDLFNNESALLNELKRLGDESFDSDISGMMWAKNAYSDVNDVDTSGDYETNNADNTKFFIDASVNRVCTTDEFDHIQNLSRELFRQVLNQGSSRFNDVTFANITVGADTISHTAPIPFEADDSISYKFRVEPAAGQNDLTGISPFGGRTYKIKLILKDSSDALTLNTSPND